MYLPLCNIILTLCNFLLQVKQNLFSLTYSFYPQDHEDTTDGADDASDSLTRLKDLATCSWSYGMNSSYHESYQDSDSGIFVML